VTPIAGVSPRLKARVAGLLYLVVIVAGVFAELFVRGRLIASGDAAATARNILAHERLFRLGFAAELVACMCNIPLAFLFYDLFRVVRRSVAWLVVFFTLVGTAIEGASLLAHMAPVFILGRGHYLGALGPEQLQALAYVSLRVFELGFTTGLVFFAGYCVSVGYLVFRSTFLPRFVGALMVLGGLCYLTNSFAVFVFPAFAHRLVPYILLPSGVGELLLCVSLLVGVNLERWNERARAADDRHR
jgi:hypothetical protein